MKSPHFLTKASVLGWGRDIIEKNLFFFALNGLLHVLIGRYFILPYPSGTPSGNGNGFAEDPFLFWSNSQFPNNFRSE